MIVLRMALLGLLGLVAGYPLGAVLGYQGTMWLSSNSHDKAVEAAFMGGFFVGPAVAVAFGLAGLVVGALLPRGPG